MSAGDRPSETLLGLDPVVWDEPPGPAGASLDRLLSPGQFVLTEPDASEFVCADRRQLQRKLAECEARGIEPSEVRWRRRDGSIERHAGRPPAGWGAETGRAS